MAIRFHEKFFGWKFTHWQGPEDYWLIETGPASEPGINGGLVRRRGAIDGAVVLTYVCGLGIPAIDDAIAKVTANGRTIALPKMAMPGVGWLVYAKDTEGNIFGMMQPDTSAK